MSKSRSDELNEKKLAIKLKIKEKCIDKSNCKKLSILMFA